LAQELLIEASDATDGFVHRVRAHFGEMITVVSPNLGFMGDTNDARIRAKWLHAFKELCSKGYLVSTHEPDTYTVSHSGFEMADRLKALVKRPEMGAQKQQQISHFWKEFRVLLQELEQKSVRLNSGLRVIYETTIAECRLPQQDAAVLFKLARALNLDENFCLDFQRMADVIGTIAHLMNLGADKINDGQVGNLRCYTEQLYKQILDMKEKWLK
jgi:hypothetical protein